MEDLTAKQECASAGATEMNSTWVSHFDSCLGCMACMTACPSGVDYGKLIEATRAQIERKTERSPVEELHRRCMFETFTRPERLRRMRLPLLAYQKSGLRAVVRGLGLLKLLPKKVRAMEALLPKLGPREAVAEVTPAAGTKRRHRSRSRRRRLRSRRTGDAAVLRSPSGTRRRGSRGGGSGEKDD